MIIFFLSIVCSHILSSDFEDPRAKLRFVFEGKTISDWPHLPESKPGLSLASIDSSENRLVYLTDSNLWIGEQRANNRNKFEWKELDKELEITILPYSRLIVFEEGSLILADNSSVHFIHCNETKCEVKNRLQYDFGILNALTYCKSSSESYFWIGGKKGLVLLQDGSGLIPISDFNEEVTSLSCRHSNELTLAVGTKHSLFVFSGKLLDPKKWDFYWVGGTIGNSIRSVSWDLTEDILWIGHCDGIDIADFSTGLFSRISGLDGLPYSNVTQILHTKNNVYVGTSKGVCEYDKTHRTWKYYRGDRFIHGDLVLSLSSSHSSNPRLLYVLTNKGGSIIEWKIWSLLEKAMFYEDVRKLRHDRLVGMCSDIGLSSYGDLRNYEERPAASGGLWTGIYLMSQVYRYAKTKSEEAKENVWKVFGAMEFLNKVTGIKGYMARDIALSGTQKGTYWFNSTYDPKFMFNGDTSSDEVVAHFVSFILVYDLVASSEEEKNRVGSLIDSIATYIVENDFQLVGMFGKPTRWGVWNPEKIVFQQDWNQERGLNSLQIIGFLLSAYRVSWKKDYYMNALEYLLEEPNFYGRNIINTKIEVPDGVNHSDDELSFLSFHILFHNLERLEKDKIFETLKKQGDYGLKKNYDFVETQQTTYFDVFYYVYGSSSVELKDRIRLGLEEFPISLIDWPYDNTERIDVLRNPEELVIKTQCGEVCKDEMMNVNIPGNERGYYRLNGNPFKLKDGSGSTEYDPGAWLLAYWMASYYEIV